MAEPSSAAPSDAFYCRYYVGHRGKFGHEFLEFELRPDGKVSKASRAVNNPSSCCGGPSCVSRPLRAAPADVAPVCACQLRYANNSNYKHDNMIRKEVYVGPEVLEEVKRIIQSSEVRVVASSASPGAGRRAHCVCLATDTPHSPTRPWSSAPDLQGRRRQLAGG